MRALNDLGVEAVLAPLILIDTVSGPELELDDVQALLITSANGLRAFCARSPNRDLPVLAVGDASARAARAAGFTNVESAGGDVDDLAALARTRLDPAAGTLLHPAGSKVAGDLAGMLAGDGFAYRREVLYEAQRARELDADTRALLEDGGVDGVLLYSPRTAATFVDLIRASGLEACCARLTVFCLSANVAAKLGDLSWAAVEVAEKPEQAALMERVAVACGG